MTQYKSGMSQSSSLRDSLQYYTKGDSYDSLIGDLPHRHKDNLVQFVTFRVADSLPQEKIIELTAMKQEFEKSHPKPWDEQTKLENQRLVGPIESRLLAKGYGECLLANPVIRDIQKIVN